MARTRSKPAVKGSEETTDTTQSAKPKLKPSESNPPKLFVLPKNVSKDARIVSLPNPATSNSNRYYHCPESGIYEFVKVAAPRSTPRSLLFTSKKNKVLEAHEVEAVEIGKPAENEDDEISVATQPFSSGYITRSADMFIATPVDLLFFLLPVLSPLATKDQKQMFLTFEDYVDKTSGSLNQVLQQIGTKKQFEQRLRAVCDTVEAGDENMFRLSVEKLAEEMASKAKTIVKRGLPPSMDLRFVRQALQVPVLNIRREDSGLTQESEDVASQVPSIVLDESSQTPTPLESTGETQLSTESQQSVATSQTSAAAEDLPAPQHDISAPEEVINLLRLQTALNYMSSSYIPAHLRSKVQAAIQDSNLIDFTPLNTHMTNLNSLREKARALRSLSDNISRKRPYDNDDEAMEARAEKKRKKEEEETKKKQASRALKNLKKADTSGMKKMSSFFQKMPKK
jgi:hypothetical protein